VNRWVKRGLLIGLFVLLFALVKMGWLGSLTDRDQVQAIITDQGWLGILWLLGMGAIFTGVGGPRQVLAFVFGFALGAANGIALSTAATVCGAFVSFYAARLVFPRTIEKRMQGRLKPLSRMLTQSPFLSALTIRLFPVGSNLLTNLAAGATAVRALPFLGGSAIGYLPQMIIFSLAGKGIAVSDHQKLIVSLVLFFLASGLGGLLYRRQRRLTDNDLTNETSDASEHRQRTTV